MSGAYREELRSTIAGFALAALLTVAAFACVLWSGWPRPTVLWIIAVAAVAQALVHLHYFLHLGLRRSARDQLCLVAFTVVLIVLMAGGTLWILGNLRDRMM